MARGKAFQLAAGAQDIEDAIHCLAVGCPRPSTFRLRVLGWEQRLDSLPQLVWNAPAIVDYRFVCHFSYPLMMITPLYHIKELSDRL
jgi:hypothetical protein